MTIRASGTPESAAIVPTPSPPGPLTATHSLSGVILGGSPGGDVIIVSARALAIVRAGLAVRAFVINGFEALCRTVTIGAGFKLRLEYGIYRTV